MEDDTFKDMASRLERRSNRTKQGILNSAQEQIPITSNVSHDVCMSDIIDCKEDRDMEDILNSVHSGEHSICYMLPGASRLSYVLLLWAVEVFREAAPMTPQLRYRITRARPRSIDESGLDYSLTGIVLAILIRKDIKAVKAQWPSTPGNTYKICFRCELNTAAEDLGAIVVSLPGAVSLVEGSNPPIVTAEFRRGCRVGTVGN